MDYKYIINKTAKTGEVMNITVYVESDNDTEAKEFVNRIINKYYKSFNIVSINKVIEY